MINGTATTNAPAAKTVNCEDVVSFPMNSSNLGPSVILVSEDKMAILNRG